LIYGSGGLLGSIKDIGQTSSTISSGDHLLNDEWNELPTYKDTFDQMSYGGFDSKS
jgi:hypothetical protein